MSNFIYLIIYISNYRFNLINFTPFTKDYQYKSSRFKILIWSNNIKKHKLLQLFDFNRFKMNLNSY